MERAPAALPVALLLLGAAAGWHLELPGIGWVAVLAAAGVALCGRRGLLVLCVAVGLALPALARCGRWSAPPPDPGRPVELVGRLTSGWLVEEGVWKATLRVHRYRQGSAVVAWEEPVQLYRAGDVAPAAGSRVRVEGYLGRAPGTANLPAGPPGPWRLWLKSPVFYGVEDRLTRSAGWRAAIRDRLLGAMGARAGARAAADAEASRGDILVRALLLGERGVLPEEVAAGLRRLGLSHLFAVSGLHVGMVAALGLLVPAGRRCRICLALLLVLGYLWLVGPRPSVVRAAGMAGLAAAALLSRRPPVAANALAVAVAGMVLCVPGILADLGFQLSVAATAGIVFVAPTLAARWSRLPRWLALPLAATASAQLVSLPVSLPVFHLWPLLAPLFNLLYVPWTAVVLAATLVWGGLATAFPAIASSCRPVLDLLAAPYFWPVHLPAGWSATLPLAWGVVGSSAVALGGLAALLRPRRGVALPAVVILGVVLAGPARSRDPELIVWDVGQGASVLLRDGRHTLLVDGGGWRSGGVGERVLLPALAAAGVGSLDAVALSHPDRDHCGGLVDLARLLPVGELWSAPGWGEDPCWRALRAVPGPRLRLLVPGDALAVGRWRLRALAPSHAGPLADNDRSLVLLAEVHGRRALLPGDVEHSGEVLLARRLGRAGLRADVLLVPHHGSRTSSSTAFLDAVSPRLGIIPVGLRNAYHHPSSEVLERLAARDVRVLRTDRDGMVRLRFHPDGAVRIELPAAPR
ncbi:MAG: DNA internalization-related competence protein ComEC/Rec2 [Thermoanaerobaculia bacterium]